MPIKCKERRRPDLSTRREGGSAYLRVCVESKLASMNSNSTSSKPALVPTSCIDTQKKSEF